MSINSILLWACLAILILLLGSFAALIIVGIVELIKLAIEDFRNR